MQEPMDGRGEDREGGPMPYGLAAVAYVALGVRFKGLVLNWIVGPLFPFAVVYALPRGLRRLGRRRSRGRETVGPEVGASAEARVAP